MRNKKKPQNPIPKWMIPASAKRITNEGGKRVWLYNKQEYLCKRDLIHAIKNPEPVVVAEEPVAAVVETNKEIENAI